MSYLNKHINKFLSFSYPVSRLKVGKRFKKGVTINNLDYLLANDKNRIIFTVTDIVVKIFDLTLEDAKLFVKDFYNF